MKTPGYAVVSIDETGWSGGSETHLALTASLGCREMAVDAYQLTGNDHASLPAGPEQVCIPLDAPGRITADEPLTVPTPGVARVPAGVGCRLHGEEPVSWFVVSTPAEPTPSAAPVVVDLETCEYTVPTTSDIPTARLTDRLGCIGMKPNARLLVPGDVVPYHTEGTQEELFVPVRGPGAVRIDGETWATETGTVVRVAPNVPRGAINDGDEDALWFMAGAPPTGGTSEWDPGAEILEWPDRARRNDDA